MKAFFGMPFGIAQVVIGVVFLLLLLLKIAGPWGWAGLPLIVSGIVKIVKSKQG